MCIHMQLDGAELGLQLGGHKPEQMLCRVINVPEIIRPCSARPRPGKPGPKEAGFASGWLSIWPELTCTCLILKKDISLFNHRSFRAPQVTCSDARQNLAGFHSHRRCYPPNQLKPCSPDPQPSSLQLHLQTAIVS